MEKERGITIINVDKQKQLTSTDVVKSFYCHDNKWTTNTPVCYKQCEYCTGLKKD